MKNLILFLLLCLVQLSFGQVSLSALKSKITDTYKFEELDELIKLGSELPISVPAIRADSAAWAENRDNCVELYLLWYEEMADMGYKITDKSNYLTYQSAPDTIETNEQIQARITSNTKVKYKKQAVSTFLIAEQRLKVFVKNAYKRKRYQKIKEQLLQFGEGHKKMASQIIDKVLIREICFTVYENNLSKQKKREEALVKLEETQQ